MSEASEKPEGAAEQLDPLQWTVSSNDAVHVSIAEPQGAFTFKPKFTYPIFGDAEQIYGYKDLTIHLAFDCKSLKPFLNSKYSAKLENPAVKDVTEEILPFLPAGDVVVKDEIKWVEEAQGEQFEIPGECVKTYEWKDKAVFEYKIYKFKLSGEGLKLHRRMQIFVLLYIEAGSYIDEEDPVWEVYCVYKCPKDGSKPTFVGFTTTYAYWKYPGHEAYDKADAKRYYRKRISQFVVLPPFQGKRHGQRLYEAIVDEWLREESTVEITVEDPSESFDDLRDRCDMGRLLFEHKFLEDVESLPVSSEWMERTRKREKLERRQFERCVEMGLLYKWRHEAFGSGIANLNEKQVRLMVKRRLYRKNRDALEELDAMDVRDKLQTAYERIREDYYRVLSKVKPAEGGEEPSEPSERQKRQKLAF